MLKTRTSGVEPLIHFDFVNGTVEPVPFVQSSFFRSLKAVPFKVLCSHTRSLART